MNDLKTSLTIVIDLTVGEVGLDVFEIVLNDELWLSSWLLSCIFIKGWIGVFEREFSELDDEDENDGTGSLGFKMKFS